MKRIILFLFLFAACLPGKTQTTADGSMPQFLFPGFSMSTVRMRNGQNQNISLNYNIVSETMVYQKGEQLYDMTKTEMIDTVYIRNSKFIPFGKVFYEVLLVAPTSLFLQHTGSVIPPGTPAGYGGTSQVSSTKQLSSVQHSGGYYNLKLPMDYTVQVNPVYWVRIENNYSSFINERQFLKLFPDKEAELKKYIKQRQIKFSRLSDIVKLVSYYDEIIR
jgi:hypothetical protein